MYMSLFKHAKFISKHCREAIIKSVSEFTRLPEFVYILPSLARIYRSFVRETWLMFVQISKFRTPNSSDGCDAVDSFQWAPILFIFGRKVRGTKGILLLCVVEIDPRCNVFYDKRTPIWQYRYYIASSYSLKKFIVGSSATW